MTALVSLRPPAVADAAPLAALLARNRTALGATGPARDDEFFTPAFQEKRIASQLEARAKDVAYAYVILDGGELAGGIAVTNVVRGPLESANVGYWVDGARHGRGVATAALATAVGLAFGELGLHRLEAGTLPDNAASQRVLEKNGFERIGLARRYLHVGGAWRDHVLFQRTAPGDRVTGRGSAP